MRAVYYTQNLRDLLWVQPIWQETGGTFCSELNETARRVHDFDASLPFDLLPTPDKLTIGRAAGSGRISLKRKTVRLRLAQVARQLKPDVIITTSNHRHAIRRDSARCADARLFHFSARESRCRRFTAFPAKTSSSIRG
jgi:hypothetical protein